MKLQTKKEKGRFVHNPVGFVNLCRVLFRAIQGWSVEGRMAGSPVFWEETLRNCGSNGRT